METSVDCILIVAAQDEEKKTYAEIDGTLLVNQTGEFHGKTIDGELNVVRNKVGACLNATQSIRLAVTIDGEDVIGSLIGDITIAHNKNYISTFSLQLGNPIWSPLVNSHIVINAVVIITSYINGQEIKLFTGLIDSTDTDYNGGYILNIKGRGYGKKLLEKTMTLISINQSCTQHLASIGWVASLDQFANQRYVTYRSEIIKYIAEQGGITDIGFPGGNIVTGYFHIGGQLIPYTAGYPGDKVSIDHSFQDQSLWDMIQKECAIEGWSVRFNENGEMLVNTTEKKTTADWEYGEDKFEELGLETNDKGIINKVTILGTVFEEEVITIEESEVEEAVEWEPEPDKEVNVSKTFADNESVDTWSHTETVYETDDCKITVEYTGSTTPEGYMFPHYLNYRFEISGLGTIKSTTWTVTGGAQITAQGKTYCNIQRERSDDIGGWPPIFLEQEFSISIVIKVGAVIGSAAEWVESENPEETVTSTINYIKILASVQDANSITTYGERKPNNEGTLQFPLAETEEQCKRIGENVIIESHRFIKQPDYLVAFNPLLVVGCTVKLTDTKIGYDENWVVEEVVHMINIGGKGEIRARTRIGCVYYA